MGFAKSALWSIFQRYIPSLIHIIATLVISRMILPSDFGEVALVMTFYQISILIISSGFAEGLMFNARNTDSLYSSVFFFNILVALLLYFILFIASGKIAEFYNIPRLSILTKVVSINMLLYGFSYVHRTRLQIEMKFGQMALISLISSTIGSAIGIVMGYLGFNVWSIVMLTLTMNFIEMILIWVVSKWVPKFTFSWKEFKKILPYSIRIFLNSSVQVIYDNIYSLVIGKFYNSKSLGYFNRMQTVVYYTTTNFMYAIELVFFPLLCKRKEDRLEIFNSYEKLMRVSTLLTFPILVCLIVLGRPIIILVLTEKWVGGTNVLQLLSTAFLLIPIIYINTLYLKITDNTKVLFYTSIIKKIVGVIALVLSLPYGITGVCCGVIIYNLFDACLSIYCTSKYIGVLICEQLKYLTNNIITNMIIASFLYFLISLFDSPLAVVGMSFFMIPLIIFSILNIFKTKEYYLVLQIFNSLRCK